MSNHPLIRAPSEGARLSTKAVTHITADASDDKGVAGVVFYVGARELCRDTTAPFPMRTGRAFS